MGHHPHIHSCSWELLRREDWEVAGGCELERTPDFTYIAPHLTLNTYEHTYWFNKLKWLFIYMSMRCPLEHVCLAFTCLKWGYNGSLWSKIQWHLWDITPVHHCIQTWSLGLLGLLYAHKGNHSMACGWVVDILMSARYARSSFGKAGALTHKCGLGLSSLYDHRQSLKKLKRKRKVEP